ncbi:MAG: hypothetical protein R3293_03345 [Candidatus Promineifilaceae bacterium]|nr:hypothetical protein [Candidatus Promineifilaceae bacterium]
MVADDELHSIMKELSPKLQQEVVEFARSLQENKVIKVEPEGDPRFYLCPVCFSASRQRLECHDQLMIPCNANKLGDCKPLMDEAGNFSSRAPRWFIVSLNRIPEDEHES